eukprot:8268701-Karenia_brevis.AAC.1
MHHTFATICCKWSPGQAQADTGSQGVTCVGHHKARSAHIRQFGKVVMSPGGEEQPLQKKTLHAWPAAT